jgi:hypothetical protein
MGSFKMYSFIIEKPETCAMASKVMKTIFYLVSYCLENFRDNYYVDKFVKNLYARNI